MPWSRYYCIVFDSCQQSAVYRSLFHLSEGSETEVCCEKKILYIYQFSWMYIVVGREQKWNIDVACVL